MKDPHTIYLERFITLPCEILVFKNCH